MYSTVLYWGDGGHSSAYLPQGSEDEKEGILKLGGHDGPVQCCAKASSHMNKVGLTRWMSPGYWIP
jgi:hypothetical protein